MEPLNRRAENAPTQGTASYRLECLAYVCRGLAFTFSSSAAPISLERTLRSPELRRMLVNASTPRYDSFLPRSDRRCTSYTKPRTHEQMTVPPDVLVSLDFFFIFRTLFYQWTNYGGSAGRADTLARDDSVSSLAVSEVEKAQFAKKLEFRNLHDLHTEVQIDRAGRNPPPPLRQLARAPFFEAPKREGRPTKKRTDAIRGVSVDPPTSKLLRVEYTQTHIISSRGGGCLKSILAAVPSPPSSHSTKGSPINLGSVQQTRDPRRHRTSLTEKFERTDRGPPCLVMNGGCVHRPCGALCSNQPRAPEKNFFE